MEPRGVTVTCKTRSEHNSTVRCSGILLAPDWVLTTGNILANSLQIEYKKNKNVWKSLLNSSHKSRLINVHDKSIQLDITVMLPHLTSNYDTRALIPVRESDVNLNLNKQDNAPIAMKNSKSSDVSEFKSELRYLWHSEEVEETLKSFLSSWDMGMSVMEDKGNSEDDNAVVDSEIVKMLFPLFLLVKLKTKNDSSSEEHDYNALGVILHDICSAEEFSVRRGLNVHIESTPFGNHYFYNSISEGIVSNVFGLGGCLLLTDATTAIGSEGGPIFVTAHRCVSAERRLVGMVVCSVSSWRGEWVGFTLGVALQPILRCMLMTYPLSSSSATLKPAKKTTDVIAGVDDCVVLVRCGVNWGSGVVVDAHKGIILTCSHVVHRTPNGRIEVHWDGRSFPGKILFQSKHGVAYDVAVLKVEPGIPFRSVALSTETAVKGEPVVAAGFPLFSEDDNVRPTVTRGVVSHVSDPAAMLQTTCCVQSGASGGAILRYNGTLLGIISCNTVDSNTGALFPRINMAVPSSVLAEHVNNFLRTGDLKNLAALECKDPVVQRLWKLQTNISKL